jgi:hypothetical protein
MDKDKVIQECVEVYIKTGPTGVYDYVQKHYPGLPWGYCDACDTNVPYVDYICLVCENENVEPNEEIN